ncbi:hypothetical protein KEM54_000734 [Ascosphaera aggregata]|nr:hypothetical protein KEM54_000734 [Ascosphaera aggregata]
MSARTLSSFSLEGSVTVVTGGARGLGMVMGYACVQSGSDLAIVDLNGDEAKETAKALTEQYKKEHPEETRVPLITAYKCNVTEPDSVNKCVADIIAAHGKIDKLITSAGFSENIPAEDYPHDRLQAIFDVNVTGSYLWAQAVAKHAMENNAEASILLIGSMSGAIVNIPQPQAPYNITKAAVRHMAASLAVEWATKKIRVNCLSPGYMITAMTRKIIAARPDLNEAWTSKIPQGVMGEPEDLSGAAVYLLSNASRYVTGAELRVDGGYTLP